MSKKHNGLLWRVLKIWGTCLVIAFCVLGAIAIKRVGVPVVTMYKEASRDVSKSSKDTFKAEQTSIVYDADGNEIKKLKQEKDVSCPKSGKYYDGWKYDHTAACKKYLSWI